MCHVSDMTLCDTLMTGGGHFIGVDGKMREHMPSANVVALPEDALPSSEEFNRHLEAITIGEGTCSPPPLMDM